MTPENLRADLLALLGAGRPRSASARTLGAQPRDGFTLERLEIDPGFGGAPIPALFVRPPGPGPFPAVLYCHAHGGTYPLGKSELIDGRPALQDPPYGPALAARGIASLCLDMPAFEQRQEPDEQTLAKALLWQGKTLFGLMLDELAAGLDVLEGRAEVAPGRIGALGLSMGCTHGWWLAALDERVRCVASLCCLADMGELLATGAHADHNLYMVVPGLPARHRTGRIAGLIAPRPHLSTVGARDPLTPPSAVAIADRDIRAAYQAAGAPENWTLLTEPEAGHEETPRMRREVLAFLDRHLRDGHLRDGHL